MNCWLRDVFSWLRSFPRPWRVIRIDGDVISAGGSLEIGAGVTVYVNGNVRAPASGFTISASDGADVRIKGNLYGLAPKR